MPSISVIIAYYKNIPFLELLLHGFAKQTASDFELVIAEDDNSDETKAFLSNQSFNFPIQHVQQEDLGFRKCRILNKAIVVAKSDYLVFIDGDCIPHTQFIKSYLILKHMDCCFGRRVMLSEQHTNTILCKETKLSLVSLIRFGSSEIKHSFYFPSRKPTIAKNKGIWGCNWGIKKSLLIKVNGFDEDYLKAGIGEDVDIEWRLRKAGVPILYAKHNAIVYHLYHPSHYGDAIVQENMQLLKSKKEIGQFYCVNGLKKGNPSL